MRIERVVFEDHRDIAGGRFDVIGAGVASSAARLAILAALVTLGIAVYFTVLQMLGVVTLKELTALQRRS
jgi:hypothetical protein